MNCIYCNSLLEKFYVINGYLYCKKCLIDYDVDILYRYSDPHQSYSMILLNVKMGKWACQVIISPLIPCIFLCVADTQDTKYSTQFYYKFLSYHTSEFGFRKIIHPLAHTNDFKVLTLQLNSLWLPQHIRDKIKTYLLFL